LLAILFAGTASAADLAPAAAEPSAPVYLPFSWTGPYVGAQIGWLHSDGKWNIGLPGSPPDPFVGPVSYSGDGVVGGIHAGYNWQWGNFVVGPEADIEATSAKAQSAFGFTETADLKWQGSVRLRAGYAFDRLLPYITGGVAFGDFDYTLDVRPFPGEATFSEVRTGATIGAGIEYAFSDKWSARLEYRYTDYGKASGTGFPIFIPAVQQRHEIHTDSVRFGISYRFGTY